MEEGRPSSTAMGAALLRAAHVLLDDDPKILRDEVALGFSGVESEAALRAALERVCGRGPDIAEAGRALLCQSRVGLGSLATIRKDGGPRLHPVCPVIAHDGLYVFILHRQPLAKVHDLLRDGRFALHAFPNPEVDDEFVVSGRARRSDDQAVRQGVYEAYTATGAFTSTNTLFEFWLERVLHAKYGPRPSWPPVYTKWASTAEAG